MRTLLALIYKDVKLFLRSAGVLALVLPLLLLPVSRAFVSDTGSAGLIQGFPIAVRDLDGTVMSRSLITQLRQVELFTQVRVLDRESDEAALGGGAAAVVTVPEGFFYDLYTMSDCPVEVVLNGDMPTQSAVFEAIFTSVMGIIRASDCAAVALYRFAAHEPDEALWRQIRNSSGERLALDALGRQGVFEFADAVSDGAGALTRRLAACVLSVLAMFFALGAVKTVPEERALGVLPRLRAARGAGWAFWASKYLAALALSAPSMLASAWVAGLGLGYTSLLYAGLLAGAFAVMGVPAARLRDPGRVQRAGNLVILASLALGGTLVPARLLPGAARALSRFTLPHLAALALDARAAGFGVWETLGLVWPLYVLWGLAAVLSLPPERRSGNNKAKTEMIRPSGAGEGGFFARLGKISLFRLSHLAGGVRGGALILASALVCALAAGARGDASALKIGVCLRDDSAEARELAESLDAASGVEVTVIDEREGRRALLTGELEGLLVIGRGYGEALSSGGQLPLSYRSSSSAGSARGAREIAAGLAVAQVRRAGCAQDARELLGREISEAEALRLRELFDGAAADIPELYHIATSGGRAAAEPFAPSPLGFGLLAALFTLLTCSAPLSGRDARAVRRRLRSVRHGAALELLSSLLALWGIGFAVMLAVLLPCGAEARSLCAAALGTLDLAALALALSRLSRAGAVDSLAAPTALLICLPGGCFADLAALSPALARVSLFSPAGLIAAAAASPAAAVGVMAEAACFACAAWMAER